MANTERQVALVDFIKEYREVGDGIRRAIDRVCESGWYVLGQEVQGFEQEFANYIGVDHTVGVASGTDAITLALKALGIKEGDGVVVPANVYPSAFGVAHSGATLQLADVDPYTLNLTVGAIEKAVNEKTRAVLAVHLYGNPVNIKEISDFCKKKDLFLVEDCAQATGAMYGTRRAGSFGDLACFSFYPTKNLGAYGDAGAVVTNNEDLAEKIKLWRMYGEVERYESVLVGHNSRLDEMQAAILRAKLKHVDRWNDKKRAIASRYEREFSNLPVRLTSETAQGRAVYHLFVLQTTDRDNLTRFLKDRGIAVGVHYPRPIHTTESFMYLGYKEGDFPVSENASRIVLSLPIFPQMTEDDTNYIIGSVKNFYLKQ